jgi:glycosyltransferase involved in cell wall biosynthesis
MRVLLTTDVVGGVWQFTKELATGLLEKDCSVALVSFGGTPSVSQRDWCALINSTYGVRFRFDWLPVPLEWMEDNDLAYPEAAARLMRIAKEFHPELLHSNQFCFGAVPIDCPKVITAHSDVLSWAEACRNEALEDSLWLRQYLRLVTNGLQAATLLVAPTRWMLDAFARHHRSRVRGVVIHNGRSIPRIRSVDRQMRALTAGRLWDEAKDVRMLEQVSSPMPLLVAGDTRLGSTQRSLPQDVTWLGPLSEIELLRYMEDSAVYICTSRYEPFGLAPLEAALCGCALLVRDIPSLREVWGEDALYFTDKTSLSDLLQTLFADPDMLAAAGKRSERRARRYTPARMVDEYYKHYCAALSEDQQHVA